jgi:hypothetical protein
MPSFYVTDIGSPLERAGCNVHNDGGDVVIDVPQLVSPEDAITIAKAIIDAAVSALTE